MTAVWVGIGGALGALARFGVGSWMATMGTGSPWATFAVNVSGSLLLGVVMGVLPAMGGPPATRAFLAIGVCGGFTTFSAFDLDTMLLLGDGRLAAAAAYSAGTVAACLAGVAAGLRAGQSWARVRGVIGRHVAGSDRRGS